MQLRPDQRWPREVVVENGDGTVSLLADIAVIDGTTVRARRADDVFRSTLCDCQHPETTAGGFAAVSVSCSLHGDA
jgi:hypothetical protein